MSKQSQRTVHEPERETSSADITALIAQANAEHDARLQQADAEFKAKMTALLGQRRDAEDREARLVDTSIPLAQAIEAVNASTEPAREREALAGENSVVATQERWWREYGPAIDTGHAVLRELRRFDKQHGESLRAAERMSSAELMVGLPKVGLAGDEARRIVTMLLGTDESPGTAGAAVTLMERVRTEIEGAIREIERTIEDPHRWSSGINGNGVAHPDTVRDLNERRRTILAPADVMDTLNAHARAVAGQLQAIAAMRAKYASSPDIHAEPVTLPRLDLTSAPEGILPVQTRAETERDLFLA